MATKLHEILAIEPDREAAARAAIEETKVTFDKRANHFKGHVKSYRPFNESDADSEDDILELVDTVPSKLEHALSIIGRALDVTVTKEVTNQQTETRAAIEIDGVAITDPLPGTSLLTLESKLKGVLAIFQAIPTLAPGRNWMPDADKGKGIYRDMNQAVTFRTRKVPMSKVLVEPTPHHPAQIERWTEDVKVGKTTETSWSSMMSPADKSELLARTQNLINAVKQARMRANSATAVQTKVADKLFAYLLNGK
jgi:hypothetical protein